MTRLILVVLTATLLSACAAKPVVQQPPAPIRKPTAGKAPAVPPPVRAPQIGVDRVIGKDARALLAMFGPALQDVRENGARKMQFGGAGCILDTYLYPPASGREPVVTYVDARLPDGRDTDRAACIVTLSRGR